MSEYLYAHLPLLAFEIPYAKMGGHKEIDQNVWCCNE